MLYPPSPLDSPCSLAPPRLLRSLKARHLPVYIFVCYLPYHQPCKAISKGQFCFPLQSFLAREILVLSHLGSHYHLSIETNDFPLLEVSFLHHHLHDTIILRQEVVVLLDQIFIGHPVSPVTVPAKLLSGSHSILHYITFHKRAPPM